MNDQIRPSRQDRRLRRQFEALSRQGPRVRATISSVLEGRLRYVRLPLGLLLIAGGMAAVLPVFGLWMIPLGFLLIAVDVPLLRPAVAGGIVRLRRRARVALGKGGRLAWLGDLLYRRS